MNITAKAEKENFILHYLEDWIPERLKPETLQRLDELISNYCKEQREKVLTACKFSSDGQYYYAAKDEIVNAKEPE
jgi:hypothetical protein